MTETAPDPEAARSFAAVIGSGMLYDSRASKRLLAPPQMVNNSEPLAAPPWAPTHMDAWSIIPGVSCSESPLPVFDPPKA